MGRNASVLAFVGACVALAGVGRAQGVPGPDERVLVLTYLQSKAVLENEIIPAIERNNLDRKLPIYIGSFGMDREMAMVVHARLGANGRYAPIFTLSVGNDRSWTARQPRLPSVAPNGAQTPVATAAADAYSGPFPVSMSGGKRVLDVTGLSMKEREHWGLELGRRFRDEIWNFCERYGVPVDAWQLNEISPTAGNNKHKKLKALHRRQLCRWVLEGLYEGRKELGDRPLAGMVSIAPHDLADKALLTSEVRGLWKTIDRTCFRVLSEEYPFFEGDPVAHDQKFQHTVEKFGHLQVRMNELASGGAPFHSLARKIVPECTPGLHCWKTWQDAQHQLHFVHTYKKAPDHKGGFNYDPATHAYVPATPPGTGEYEIDQQRVPAYLGGELDGDRVRASEWRRAYMRERLRMGATGLGEWAFANENADPSVVESVFEDIAWALRQK